MIKVCFFTKNREMQFRALIESFLFFTNFTEKDISVITPYDKNYEDIYHEFKDVTWLFEDQKGGFDQTLRSFIYDLKDDEFTVFKCDDSVFTRFINFNPTVKYLNENPDCLGFSSRHGTNIVGPPVNVSHSSLIFKWYWQGQYLCWGYPFDLEGCVYRNSMLKNLCEMNSNRIRIPNDFESFGASFFMKNPNLFPTLACFNTVSCNYAHDLQRVQDLFPNNFYGGPEHQVDYLSKIYKEGKRLNWHATINLLAERFFIRDTGWAITDKPTRMDK